jgi:hypothetical protein
LPSYQKAIVLGVIHKKSGGNKSDNKSDMQNKPIRKTTSLYSIQGALKSRSDSRWISLPSFSHMRKAFADGAWAAHRAMYGGDMKYRLVETAPDFKIIDEWESPSVSVKTPTANRKPEATYEELQEQRKKLTYALVMCRRELVDVLDDINKERVPHDGDDFHEALRISKEALAAVKGGGDE